MPLLGRLLVVLAKLLAILNPSFWAFEYQEKANQLYDFEGKKNPLWRCLAKQSLRNHSKFPSKFESILVRVIRRL